MGSKDNNDIPDWLSAATQLRMSELLPQHDWSSVTAALDTASRGITPDWLAVTTQLKASELLPQHDWSSATAALDTASRGITPDWLAATTQLKASELLPQHVWSSATAALDTASGGITPDWLAATTQLKTAEPLPGYDWVLSKDTLDAALVVTTPGWVREVAAQPFLTQSQSPDWLLEAAKLPTIAGMQAPDWMKTVRPDDYSAIIAAGVSLSSTTSSYAAISSTNLDAQDLLTLANSGRFGLVSSTSLEFASAKLTSAVDDFGLISIALPASEIRNFRTELSGAVEAAVSSALKKFESTFNARNGRAVGGLIVSAGNVETEGVERNKRAYGRLLAFEIKLRKFVCEEMAKRFGSGWVTKQVPSNIKVRWEERREAAVSRGRADEPLINFADFSDYVQLIEKGDNWREVFQAHFKKREGIKESLVRLHPIRIDTMHARILSEDDELWLEAEVRRMLKFIDQA